MRNACTLACSQSRGREGRLKPASAPGLFPETFPLCQVNIPAPLASSLISTLRWGLSCETPRRLRPEVASEQGGGAITGTYIASMSETVWVFVLSWSATACIPTHSMCPHWPLLLQHGSLLGQGCQCRKQGEHTIKENRASSGPTLRVSAPATWTLIPPLVRWLLPLSRGEAPAHTWLWPWPLHLQPHFLPRW